MLRKHSRNDGFAILASYFGMVSLAAAVNSGPVCLTGIADTFGLGEARMGLLAGAMFFGLVLGICVSGPLSDRFGMKPFLLLGAVGQACGLGGIAMAPAYPALLGAAFAAGFGGGILDALLSPFVCALRPDEKTRAMNLLHAFYCIGAAGMVAVAMLLLGNHFSWRTVFAVGAVPSVVAFGALALSPVAHAPPSVRATYVPLRGLLRRGDFYLLVLAMLFCGGTELGPAQWLPAYAERTLGWSRSMAPVILLLFSMAMAGGRLLGARLARTVTPERLVIGAALFCSVLILVTSRPGHPLVSVCSGVVFGLAVGTLWPTTLALAAGRFPGGGAAMFSAYAASGNAGGMIVPWAMGVVAEYSSMHWALAGVAMLPLLLAAIFLRAK
ncbi:MAG: MFS transporter [Kiritimatiellaeota bacterium]|nr:MFS transporter [Kiritimatiellota bacterium]